jgi:hypothetical protein
MKLELTERPRISDLKTFAKVKFRDACEAFDHDLAEIALALGFNPTNAERWVKKGAEYHWPGWVLYSREAIPDAVFEQVVADIRAARAQQVKRGARPTLLGAAMTFLRRAGEAVSVIALAGADHEISTGEEPDVRRAVGGAVESGRVVLEMTGGEGPAEREGVQ